MQHVLQPIRLVGAVVPNPKRIVRLWAGELADCGRLDHFMAGIPFQHTGICPLSLVSATSLVLVFKQYFRTILNISGPEGTVQDFDGFPKRMSGTERQGST